MSAFKFKQFSVDDCGCGMKIGTDSVMLGAWFLPDYRAIRRALDVGAGSGLLSLMTAQECPDAHIDGIEISTEACQAARANYAASPWCDRIKVECADFSEWQRQSAEAYDIIISNPPYFTNGGKAPEASRATARHQASLTYESLVSTPLLAPGGHLGLVAPAEFEQDIIFHATMARLRLCRLCRVSTSPNKPVTRILLDFVRQDSVVQAKIEHMSLRNADGTYTQHYRELTEDFYLKL